MSTSANSSPGTERRAGQIAVRAGVTALFIEAALWSAIRLLSMVYVLAGEADLSAKHQLPGWTRLAYLGVSVAVAAVLILAGAGLRNGAGPAARLAQVLAIGVNFVVFARGAASVVRPSGAQAAVVAAFVVGLAAASLAGLVVDLGAAIADRRRGASTGGA
jgi:hypothetical protein